MGPGTCTDLFEHFSEKSLKGDLSNDTTLTLPLFSLINAFKKENVRHSNERCEVTGMRSGAVNETLSEYGDQTQNKNE